MIPRRASTMPFLSFAHRHPREDSVSTPVSFSGFASTPRTPCDCCLSKLAQLSFRRFDCVFSAVRLSDFRFLDLPGVSGCSTSMLSCGCSSPDASLSGSSCTSRALVPELLLAPSRSSRFSGFPGKRVGSAGYRASLPIVASSVPGAPPNSPSLSCLSLMY
jgi:hypothetical protein